jgi:quinol monooxygenase YgiN
MIGIIARLRTKPGQADAFAAQTSEMAKTVAAAEPESVFYNAYRAADDENLFVALELYETPEAVDAHGASAHVAKSMETVPDMLEGDMDVDIVTLVYAGDTEKYQDKRGADVQFGVTAYCQIKPGVEAEWEAIAREMVDATRSNEPGNVFYGVFKTERDGEYVFMERWADRAAVDAHGKTAHVAEIAPRFGPYNAGPPVITEYKMVE